MGVVAGCEVEFPIIEYVHHCMHEVESIEFGLNRRFLLA
jgi:hypothetical protein